MNKTKALTCMALTALLLTSLMVFSASAATVDTFTISVTTRQYTFTLPAGTTFNGSISTAGTIRVWVNTPNASQIVNLGLVDDNAEFGFGTEQTGNYTVNFENTLTDSIQVTFSYETDPNISGSNSTAVPFSYLPIFIIITVVGCILIFFSMRRKNKKQAPK